MTPDELRRLLCVAPDVAALRFVAEVAVGGGGAPALVRVLTPSEQDALLTALFQLFTGAGARVH